MLFIEFTADVFEVDGVEGYNLSKKLRLDLLIELLVGVSIEKSTFFSSMSMKITIEEHPSF